MSNLPQEIMEFIKTAERNRIYPHGTASGRKAALRLFEQELNEEEKASLDTLRKNLDQIYQNVYSKNKSKLTAASLVTYRNRMESLINEYETYGLNPTKMAGWSRPVKKVRSTPKTDKDEINHSENPAQITPAIGKEFEFSRFELPLRPNVKAIIIVPSNISKDEVKKLRSYIEFLDSIAVD